MDKGLIYIPAWMKILRILYMKRTQYGSAFKDDVSIVYSHIHHILQELIKQGLIGAEKKGRRRYYYLTHSGLEMAKGITRTMAVLDLKGGIK